LGAACGGLEKRDADCDAWYGKLYITWWCVIGPFFVLSESFFNLFLTDLCNQNGVEGWPTILMFDQGKVVGEFKGPRELEDLKVFVKQYVKKESEQSSTSTTQTSMAPSTSLSTKPLPPPPVVNPTGKVLSLDRELFTTTLSKAPAFVKFFAPWCGHCKKLAPVWQQLARHMQNKLTIAEVNCDDNSSLCKSQGIEGYPTLIYFDGSGGRSEYNGGRKLDQFKAFAEKTTSAYVISFVNIYFYSSVY
jgi:thioredoxin domain-containing protein 5